MIAKLNAKQLDLLSLAAICVVLAGAYFIIFHRGFTRYCYLKTQEKMLQESLKSTPQVDQALIEIRNDIQTVETKLTEFNKRLPKEKNIDAILKQITHASSRAGVDLKSIEPLKACPIREANMPKKLSSRTSLLGDVVISLPTAIRQARAVGRSIDEELAILLVHGVLHLCGYDHERNGREAARMSRREQVVLRRIAPIPHVVTLRARQRIKGG